MFRELYEWFCGKVNPFSLDNLGEKQTPETNSSEQLPQPEESDSEKYHRTLKEQIQIENGETLKRFEMLKEVSEKFNIGEHVEYVKIPNENVKFYVSEYHEFALRFNYNGRLSISPAYVSVKYFDSNNTLQTIVDETKWFKKV